MQRGFITIPVIIIALFGTVIVGGGGYAVYKVNQVQQESDQRVAELERKFEEVASTTANTEPLTDNEEQATTTEETATSTEMEETEETEAAPVVPVVSEPVSAPTPQPVVQNIPAPTPVDVCLNIAGLQTTVPDGYKLSGSSCVKMEDKCQNIEGIQEEVPAGMLLTREYGCISERELDKIEQADREQRQAEREIEELAEKCDGLKTLVYEADQEILDIEEKYRIKKQETASAPGQTLSQGNASLNSLNSQMYNEIAPIETERNKNANEYNFLCVN